MLLLCAKALVALVFDTLHWALCCFSYSFPPLIVVCVVLYIELKVMSLRV